MSFHVLRHSYGSWLAGRGVPLQVIAEALGHADTRITSRHYAHLLPSYVADTIRANLPSFGIKNEGNIEALRPKKARRPTSTQLRKINREIDAELAAMKVESTVIRGG